MRERKGGITEEDLENATSFLMADLGGAHKFTWFQFEKWCVHESGTMAMSRDFNHPNPSYDHSTHRRHRTDR